MKKYLKYSGMFLIYLGAFTLLLVFAAGQTGNCFLLFAPLVTLVAGLVTHVRIIKKESRY